MGRGMGAPDTGRRGRNVPDLSVGDPERLKSNGGVNLEGNTHSSSRTNFRVRTLLETTGITQGDFKEGIRYTPGMTPEQRKLVIDARRTILSSHKITLNTYKTEGSRDLMSGLSDDEITDILFNRFWFETFYEQI